MTFLVQGYFRYLFVLLPIVILAGLTLFFLIVSPSEVVEYIGVKNAYVFMFVLALFGGMTTMSGIPYHFMLIAFASAGLNPYVLGAVTAAAVTIGDSTTYYVGYYGRALVSGRLETMLVQLSRIRETHPRLLPAIFFSYGAFVPFSSDLVTIPMGMLRYPVLHVMIPLGVGTLIFNTGLALMAVYGYEWVSPFIS